MRRIGRALLIVMVAAACSREADESPVGPVTGNGPTPSTAKSAPVTAAPPRADPPVPLPALPPPTTRTAGAARCVVGAPTAIGQLE